MAELLVRLVAIESVNPPGRHLAECAELLRLQMDRLGLGAEMIEIEPCGAMENP